MKKIRGGGRGETAGRGEQEKVSERGWICCCLLFLVSDLIFVHENLFELISATVGK